MTPNPDPQLCTMSDAEEGFRNALREVFGNVEWDDIQELREGRLSARRGVVIVSVSDYGTPGESWIVHFSHTSGEDSTLKRAVEDARVNVSNAVRALESVGMECEP